MVFNEMNGTNAGGNGAVLQRREQGSLYRINSQFSLFVEELDDIFDKGINHEVKGVLDEVLNPDTILFLLLLVELARINGFFQFLQIKI